MRVRLRLKAGQSKTQWSCRSAGRGIEVGNSYDEWDRIEFEQYNEVEHRYGNCVNVSANIERKESKKKNHKNSIFSSPSSESAEQSKAKNDDPGVRFTSRSHHPIRAVSHEQELLLNPPIIVIPRAPCCQNPFSEPRHKIYLLFIILLP